MFNLEREVEAWSQTVHAGRCNSSASAAELSDHLYCEIDRARADGRSEEEAFRAAVAALGSVPALAAEHAKNRSWFQVGCAAARFEGSRPSGEHRGLLLAHALTWAALMLGTALLLSKSASKDAFSLLLITILLPCWYASEQILRRALRTPPAAGA